LVTRRLASNWLREAVEIKVDSVRAPVYRIKHQFPVIAVIGIFRPRMFVAEQVLGSLDENEFRAAIAHEYGHLRARDNFKRTLLRICRDLLILPLGKGLDRAWAENAESLADEHAARTGSSTALDLASALVKIAKIVPAGSGPAMPAGAYLVEDLSVDVTSRVRRLVRFSDDPSFADAGMGIFGPSAAFWLWSAALMLLLVLPLVDQRSLAGTHEIVEQFVNILQ
jgi:Zn-dependent protease with chaperone function